jgi:hypothetical protein
VLGDISYKVNWNAKMKACNEKPDSWIKIQKPSTFKFGFTVWEEGKTRK